MMFRQRNTVIVLAAAILLSGCVANPMGRYNGADVGYLVASIGEATGTDYFADSLLYREVGKGKDTRANGIQFPGIGITHTYKWPDGIGDVSVLKLPPGKYEIYRVVALEDASRPEAYSAPNKNFPMPLEVLRGCFGALCQIVYQTTPDFSIPFIIKPGEITYIGSYQAVTLATYENFMGITRSTGGIYFVLRDERERDIRIAAEREKELASRNVNYSVPNAADIETPYIRVKKVGQE